MNYFLYFIFSTLTLTTVVGQMSFSTLKHNFGELESYDNRFVDITITNNGVKDGYILSVRKPSEVMYIQSSAFVEKGKTLTLRFQVNPMQKGKFSYVVDIYTSDKDEPHKLILSGNLLKLAQRNQSSLTSCPDFNSHPIGKSPNQFDLTVITIDAETKTELENTHVKMIQNGIEAWRSPTDKAGKIKKNGTIGMAYFIALHTGYENSEKGTFISNDRNRVVIELKKIPQIAPPIKDLSQEIIVQQTPEHTTIEETKKEESTTPLITSIGDLEEDNFDVNLFVPVNLTFVLDVSSSMNQGDKMELMKYSINQLSEMIRENDRISIVTYASKAKVLLPPTTGVDKSAVKQQVQTLKAAGMTAGGDGIKLGFEQAEKAYIENGVNHVFVITDGAFNNNNYDYKKLIKKFGKKNIQLSVVGVLNDSKSEISMREVAKIGSGSYVPIFNINDATKNIRQFVRQLSFRK